MEIGALRGETTELLLDLLGPAAQLHVIDPRPQFDPAEHERRFPGRYLFHRDTSHAVLPTLEPMDVALIDGDHNWFTVHGELEMLREGSRRGGETLPLLVMHDVCWPYGRRDLYYGPEGIPEEYRRPHEQLGMRPGHERLVASGGVNPSLDNAVTEGGPRNGVMTALEDFMDSHDRPLRRLVLPIYFGLAIVAEENRLEATPELAAAMDRLESPEVRLELLELSESLRLQSVVAEHTAVYGGRSGAKRAARRYLDLLKGALLNQHHLENEARLEYVAAAARAGREPDSTALRDPGYHLRTTLDPLELSRQAGSALRNAPGTSFFPYTAMGRRRLDHLERCLETIRAEQVPGDLVECGVGRGGGSIFCRGFLEAQELEGRQVWAVDAFRNPQIGARDDLTADVNMVREGFARFDLLDARVRFLQGDPAETLRSATMKVALLRIDARLVTSVGAALDAIYANLAIGGFVVIDGVDDPDCREALDAFRHESAVAEPMTRVDTHAVYWRKLSEAATGREAERAEGRTGVPLMPTSPASPCELSVLVVFHDMRREAERTLHSLSRAYQLGVEDLDYEVIAIENGSAPDQSLGSEFVSSFGSEFRYLDLSDEATPSPAHALNRGAETARGEVIALMIDGAHLLTPGVLRCAMQGIRTHSPAMVATQQFYVGPGQQVDTIGEGYDRAYEDRLFGLIDWPTDGYRLFEIGHFIGTRDWFDGMWESNCTFVPRSVAEQVGLMDEGFSMPGGGFANLDLYERIASTPGLNVVSLLGEGSFHQIHGGTTTNLVDAEKRAHLLASYRDQYADLRGRTFRIVTPFHYVGSMTDAARRTRPRRMGASAFANTAQRIAGDARPESPAPLPSELEAEFTEAYWRSFRWRGTTWLGHRVARSPSDLLAYQQMIADGLPDWVVETGTGDGGRALYLASICELAGRGHVLSIGTGSTDELPQHPRLTYIEGDPLDGEIVAQVRETVGEHANALAVFGVDKARNLVDAFSLYSSLVPIDSWVVLEDTIMNGHPVWPGMGPGPAEAVAMITHNHPEFVPDPALARLGVTFNPGGYLKRVA